MKFLNKQIGLVFQDPYLIRELSVLENCMIKGLIAGNSFQAEITRTLELLEKVGLADKAYCKLGHYRAVRATASRHCKGNI